VTLTTVRPAARSEPRRAVASFVVASVGERRVVETRVDFDHDPAGGIDEVDSTDPCVLAAYVDLPFESVAPRCGQLGESPLSA
jgi:hypothetical protein